MANAASPELLERLLQEHGTALELFARQWSPRPDDCVQEAFVALARQQTLPDAVVPWLYRVVRNQAISDLRSDTRRRHHENNAAATNQSWFEDDRDPGHADAVTEALEALTDDEREIIVARIWGRLSFDELAEMLSVSRSTAHRRYEMGLSNLRERLGLTWTTKNSATD